MVNLRRTQFNRDSKKANPHSITHRKVPLFPSPKKTKTPTKTPPTKFVKKSEKNNEEDEEPWLYSLPDSSSRGPSSVGRASTPETPENPSVAQSPMKTRMNHFAKCLVCSIASGEMVYCPECQNPFHDICLFHTESLDFLEKNPTKWSCPKCITCSKCKLYIDDPENVQCYKCLKAFHGYCKPKAKDDAYVSKKWLCNRCQNKNSSGIQLEESSDSEFEYNTPVTSPQLDRKQKTYDGEISEWAKKLENERLSINERLLDESMERQQIHQEFNDIANRLSNAQKDSVKRLKKNRASIFERPTTSDKSIPSERPNTSKKAQIHENSQETKTVDKARRISTSTDMEIFNEAKRRLAVMNEHNPPPKLSKAQLMAIEPGSPNPNQWIYLGPTHKFKALCESSYPEPMRSAPVVYICHFCLRPISQLTQFQNHLDYCNWHHPPGNEIYREGSISFWEIDGSLETTYCRNLCLLAKLLLSSKTLHYEVETFLFYILTEHHDDGEVIVGYFSKEKNPGKNNNLSCLLTFPSSQRYGYGKLLIDLSYHLSKREHKVGSPEHPLSDLGLVTYRSYWKSVIVCYLRNNRGRASVSLKEISEESHVHVNDLFQTLVANGMLRHRKGVYYIDASKAYLTPISSFRRRVINPDLLVWEPEFEVDPYNRMNSYVDSVKGVDN